MHICFLNMPIEYYSPVSGGAVSTIIAETGSELEQAGHQVTVVTWSDETGHHKAGRVVSMGAMPRSNLFSKSVDRAFGWVIRRSVVPYLRYLYAASKGLRKAGQNIDAIIVFNDYLTPVWIRRWRPDARRIVWLQNDEPVPGRFVDIRTDIDGVLCCSAYIAGTAVEHGVPKDRVRVAASGVNSEVFCPRDNWLEPRAPLRVLCLGRLDPNKGHDAALAIVAHAQEHGHCVAVTLAGASWWYGNDRRHDQYEEPLLQDLSAVEGIYLGLVPRPAVAELVRSHDVAFVLSRSQEPFGLVALEAMASGCAVIASNRGGLPEACGGAAILVDPDDEHAGLAAFEHLLDDPVSLAKHKEASRRRALQAPWMATAKVVEDVCRYQ